ncbi:uracil-xanthine permease family protein, partial [Clostridioides difficile]
YEPLYGIDRYINKVLIAPDLYTSLININTNYYSNEYYPEIIVRNPVSIIFGYILSLILGIVNFSSIQEFTLVALPKPLAFGLDIRLE